MMIKLKNSKISSSTSLENIVKEEDYLEITEKKMGVSKKSKGNFYK